jgi:hypothetical protein
MALPQSNPTLPTYFVLSDSHAKFLPRLIAAPTYQLVVKFVSGLKWFDPRQREISALAILQTPFISSQIQSAAAVLLLIGTNSTRSFPSSEAINHVESFISLLPNLHPHLTNTHSIVVVTTFPCLKTSFSFPTVPLLHENIHQYNEQLLILTQHLNFTLVNFKVTDKHLSKDKIHLHHDHCDLVKHSICSYFDQVSRRPSVPLAKVHIRSQEAVTRRNRRRHEKLTQLQQQFFISRTVESPWTLQHVKRFLREHLIRFAKLPPIYRTQIRIQFNNPIDLQTADATLPHDVFSASQFPAAHQP